MKVLQVCIALAVAVAVAWPTAGRAASIVGVILPWAEVIDRSEGEHPSQNRNCDDTAWSIGWGILSTTWRNCTGAIYTRDDTVMLVTNADKNHHLPRFAKKLFPGSEQAYRFSQEAEQCAAVYSKPTRLGAKTYRIYIGTGRFQKDAEREAKAACKTTNCQKLLVRCNGWEAINIFGYDETIQFAKVDGTVISKPCGGEPGVRCRVRERQ